MTGFWIAAGVLLVGTLCLVPHWKGRRVRRTQALVTRITMAGFTESPALISPRGGHAAAGAACPDPAPAAVPHAQVGEPDSRRQVS